MPVMVVASSKVTVKVTVSEFDGLLSSSVYTPLGVTAVTAVTVGPVRSMSNVPDDSEEKFPAGSTTTTLYRPPPLGVERLPSLPVVCFVRLVPKVNEVTSDGFNRYALRSALVTVEGTSHT